LTSVTSIVEVLISDRYVRTQYRRPARKDPAIGLLAGESLNGSHLVDRHETIPVPLTFDLESHHTL